jgi:hypothetical protein
LKPRGRGLSHASGRSAARRRRGRPPRCEGGPRVGELLLWAEETERRHGGALGKRLGGSVRVTEHGVRQGQAGEGMNRGPANRLASASPAASAK